MARFNFVVDNDEVLTDLMSKTRRGSKADVVRDALSLYQFLLKKTESGQKIYVGSDKDKAAELMVTTFENATPPVKPVAAPERR